MKTTASPSRVDRASLTHRLQQAADVAARKGLARRVAAALMRRLQIDASGKDLAFWIGGPQCRSNAAAIGQWVEAALEESPPDGTQAGPDLDLLADRLSRLLERLLDAAS